MSRPVPNAANAIRELFDHSKDTLSIEGLDWLSYLDESADNESDNIAATLNGLAEAFASGSKLGLPGDYELSLILFGLASRLETVSILINVSKDAKHLADKKKRDLAASRAKREGKQ